MFDIKIEGKNGLGARPPNPRTWLANSRSNVHCTATLALDMGREGRW